MKAKIRSLTMKMNKARNGAVKESRKDKIKTKIIMTILTIGLGSTNPGTGKIYN